MSDESRIPEDLSSPPSPNFHLPALPEEEPIRFPVKVVLFLLGSILNSLLYAVIVFFVVWRFIGRDFTQSVWIGLGVIAVWVVVESSGTWIEQKFFKR
jgi:hypothetical protein